MASDFWNSNGEEAYTISQSVSYINNSQNDQNINFPQKWSKLKSETSFAISFVHWFQNFFVCVCWAPKVSFLEFPKVLKIALLGSHHKNPSSETKQS